MKYQAKETVADVFTKLVVSDLKLWVYLGCTKEEKHHKQQISIDMSLIFGQVPKATTTDKIDDVFCYAKMAKTAKSVAAKKEYNLIEHLASSIHQTIIKEIHKLGYVDSLLEVKVTKLNPPVEDICGGVSFIYCG